LVADGGLRHDRLDEAGAVAHDQEVDLAARAAVVEPALERDLLAFVRADVFDIDVHVLGICPMADGQWPMASGLYAMCHPPSAISRPLCHVPSAIGHQPAPMPCAIRHRPSTGLYATC